MNYLMNQRDEKTIRVRDKWKYLTQPEMYPEFIDYIYDTSIVYSRNGDHQIEKILSIKLHWKTSQNITVDALYADETDPEYTQTNNYFISARLQEKNPRSNNHIIHNGIVIDKDLTSYIKWLRCRVINLI